LSLGIGGEMLHQVVPHGRAESRNGIPSGGGRKSSLQNNTNKNPRQNVLKKPIILLGSIH
jgi:hypothetical protein